MITCMDENFDRAIAEIRRSAPAQSHGVRRAMVRIAEQAVGPKGRLAQIEIAIEQAEERAVKLEDDYGSLENHLVAEAYGEKQGLEKALEILRA